MKEVIADRVGELTVAVASFLLMQLLYATYLEHNPDSAWLMKGFRRWQQWRASQEQRRIGWINRTREVHEPSFAELVGES